MTITANRDTTFPATPKRRRRTFTTSFMRLRNFSFASALWKRFPQFWTRVSTIVSVRSWVRKDFDSSRRRRTFTTSVNLQREPQVRGGHAAADRAEGSTKNVTVRPKAWRLRGPRWPCLRPSLVAAAVLRWIPRSGRAGRLGDARNRHWVIKGGTARRGGQGLKRPRPLRL